MNKITSFSLGPLKTYLFINSAYLVLLIFHYLSYSAGVIRHFTFKRHLLFLFGFAIGFSFLFHINWYPGISWISSKALPFLHPRTYELENVEISYKLFVICLSAVAIGFVNVLKDYKAGLKEANQTIEIQWDRAVKSASYISLALFILSGAVWPIYSIGLAIFTFFFTVFTYLKEIVDFFASYL